MAVWIEKGIAMRRRFVALLTLWLALSPGQPLAHGGGVDAKGCHTNRKTGEHHCHGRRAAPAVAAPLGFAASPGAAAAGDRNCSDFATWRAAQDFFEQAGPGDPHALDRDHDGVACEGLPGQGGLR